jgi:hypothetical protein
VSSVSLSPDPDSIYKSINIPESPFARPPPRNNKRKIRNDNKPDIPNRLEAVIPGRVWSQFTTIRTSTVNLPHRQNRVQDRDLGDFHRLKTKRRQGGQLSDGRTWPAHSDITNRPTVILHPESTAPTAQGTAERRPGGPRPGLQHCTLSNTHNPCLALYQTDHPSSPLLILSRVILLSTAHAPLLTLVCLEEKL